MFTISHRINPGCGQSFGWLWYMECIEAKQIPEEVREPKILGLMSARLPPTNNRAWTTTTHRETGWLVGSATYLWELLIIKLPQDQLHSRNTFLSIFGYTKNILKCDIYNGVNVAVINPKHIEACIKWLTFGRPDFQIFLEWMLLNFD